MVLITDLKKTAFPKKQLKKAFNAKKKKKIETRYSRLRVFLILDFGVT